MGVQMGWTNRISFILQTRLPESTRGADYHSRYCIVHFHSFKNRTGNPSSEGVHVYGQHIQSTSCIA